jgi:triacylglycerol lipase
MTPELLKFAKISATTYDNPKVAKNKFAALNYDIVKFFDVNGAQAYLLKSSSDYVLSFRGTEVSQPSDVLADLKVRKVPEESGGMVHRGFKKETDKLWGSIIETIKDIDKIYVTGHSLGAAMATIAASRIPSKVIALVTFGSPRVGNRAFVNSLSVDHYRVQNNCDTVTKVPFLFLNFRHHGTHKYMNFYGEFRDLTSWQMIKDMLRSRLKARMKRQRFIGVFDHMMAHYIAKLEKSSNTIV